MYFNEVIWKRQFVEKLEQKHEVSTEEVEETFRAMPHVRKAEKGHLKGEDSFIAYGRTIAGRYLVVVFIRKTKGAVLPNLSAIWMAQKEDSMKDKNKKIDPLPETFETEEAAGEFWDTHSTVDYLEFLTPVEVTFDIQKRTFDIPVSEDIFLRLRQQAKGSDQSLELLVDQLLRQTLEMA